MQHFITTSCKWIWGITLILRPNVRKYEQSKSIWDLVKFNKKNYTYFGTKCKQVWTSNILLESRVSEYEAFQMLKQHVLFLKIVDQQFFIVFEKKGNSLIFYLMSTLIFKTESKAKGNDHHSFFPDFPWLFRKSMKWTRRFSLNFQTLRTLP